MNFSERSLHGEERGTDRCRQVRWRAGVRFTLELWQGWLVPGPAIGWRLPVGLGIARGEATQIARSPLQTHPGQMAKVRFSRAERERALFASDFPEELASDFLASDEDFIPAVPFWCQIVPTIRANVSHHQGK